MHHHLANSVLKQSEYYQSFVNKDSHTSTHQRNTVAQSSLAPSSTNEGLNPFLPAKDKENQLPKTTSSSKKHQATKSISSKSNLNPLQMNINLKQLIGDGNRVH